MIPTATQPLPHRSPRRSVPPAAPAAVLPWILSVIVFALVVALGASEAGAGIVASILAGLAALPIGGVGAVAYRRRRNGHGPPAMLLTFLSAIGGGALAIGIMACLTGCGPGMQQRAVTAAAVAAVAADVALGDAYSAEAMAEIERQAAAGGTLDDWCRAMTPAWHTVSRIGCAVVALADLALAGQRAIDAGGGEAGEADWIAWSVAAGSLVAAVVAAWTVAEEPPAALVQAAALLGLAGGGGGVLPPSCAIVGPPPGCPGVGAP